MDYDIKTNQELKEDDRKDAINGRKKNFQREQSHSLTVYRR